MGYIKIKTFDDQTLSQFISAFEGMRQEGISRFVFDVRENSGGSLEVAASVLDKLLPDGVLVSYRDKDGNEEVLYESNGAGREMCIRDRLFPVDGVWKQAMDTFGYFFDLLAFAVLYGNTKGGRGHSFVWSGVLGTATVAVLSVMVSAALGDGFISRVSFPVHTLAGISELSIFQRLDAGYLVCWTLLSFVRGALYGFCACLLYTS